MPLLDFLPIFQETAATVRARMDADANAGLTEDDARWIDTREGSFYYDITQVVLLELARLWDALSAEVPASAFVEFAWGQYLDYHAAIFGLERKPPEAATGELLFTGAPGTVVAVGTVASAPVPDNIRATPVELEAIEFRTTAPGTTSTQLSRPGTVTPTVAQTGGALAAATYYYRVSAYSSFGQTTGSDEVNGLITTSTGRITLDWPDVAGATGYRVYRGTVAGGPYQLIADIPGAANSTYVDNGGQTPGVSGPPAINSSAGVRIAAEAVVAGHIGNVGANAVTSLETPNAAITGVTNELPMAGGEDEESDEALRERILIMFSVTGGGSIADYKRWALENPSVGKVTVIPVASGPGTVTVMIMDSAGGALSGAVVTEVQNYLDPVPGQGKGRAPVGVTVTVATPTIVLIDVAATITFEPGFNLDGTGGLRATRPAIEAALHDYLSNLDVGDDVIFEHVKAQIFQAEGVYNVSAVTIEGATADVAISGTQIADLGTVTLT